MSNILYTTTGLKITWRKSTDANGDKFNFTLHGPNQVIGKATITANQLAGYIFKNSNLKNDDIETEDEKQNYYDFYKIVGYDKKTDSFIEFGQYNGKNEALNKTKTLKTLIKERVIKGAENISWLQVVKESIDDSDNL